jgi:RNA polymerase sigma-70 factor (ECF subfamily)
MASPADFELLDAWTSGDGAAARMLIERHRAALVRFFGRKLGEPAEDLVQDTLLACVEGRDRFRRQSRFRSYLLGIARNVLFAHLRSRQHEQIDLDATRLEDESPTPSDLLARETDERLLLAALQRLPTQTRTLLELYHWQGLTGPELASVLGIGERTARSRLLRAKERLRAIAGRLAATQQPSALRCPPREVH